MEILIGHEAFTIKSHEDLPDDDFEAVYVDADGDLVFPALDGAFVSMTSNGVGIVTAKEVPAGLSFPLRMLRSGETITLTVD